jgi:hypothetical protein
MRNNFPKIGFLGIGKYSGALAEAIVNNIPTSYYFYDLDIRKFFDNGNLKAQYYWLSKVNFYKNQDDPLRWVIDNSDIIIVGIPHTSLNFHKVMKDIEAIIDNYKGEKSFVFMGNFRYSPRILINSKAIYQIMFNLGIDPNSENKQYNIIAVYNVSTNCDPSFEKVIEEISTPIIVNNYVDLIKYRFILGGGLAVLTHFFYKYGNFNNNMKKYFVEGMGKCFSDMDMDFEKILSSLIHNLNYLKKGKKLSYPEILSILKEGEAAKLIFEYSYSYSEEDFLKNLPRIFEKAFKKFLMNWIDIYLWDAILWISEMYIKLNFSSMDKAWEEVKKVFHQLYKDWNPIFKWLNLIDTQHKKIYFTPQEQQRDLRGEVLRFWYTYSEEFKKYIITLSKLLQTLSFPNRVWIITNKSEDIKEELYNLGNLALVQNSEKVLKIYDKKIKEIRERIQTSDEKGKIFFEEIASINKDASFRKILGDIKKEINNLYGIDIPDEIGASLINYYFWISVAFSSDDFKHVIYIPVYSGYLIPYSISIGITEWLGSSFIRNFKSFISSIVLPILEKQIQSHALRSAVAAIMSRNMSHNIGSHVLNYLSNPEELDSLWII